MFEVYCHTSPSGKRYVGYSRDGMAKRWREHCEESRAGSDRLVCRAIRKYGADSFKHELLAVTDTEAGAHASKRYWIVAWKTLAPGGYNATMGGDGGERSEVVLEKLRAAWARDPDRKARASVDLSERNKGNSYATAGIGRKWSVESRARRSEAMRGVKQGRRSELGRANLAAAAKNKGYSHSPETIAKMSAARRGKPWTDAQRAAHEKKKG